MQADASGSVELMTTEAHDPLPMRRTAIAAPDYGRKTSYRRFTANRVCPECRALVEELVIGPGVEEVAVYDRALTPEEVKLRYEEGLRRRRQGD